MKKRTIEENEKRKEKRKWGEIVTPVFLTCNDTLCHVTYGSTRVTLVSPYRTPVGI